MANAAQIQHMGVSVLSVSVLLSAYIVSLIRCTILGQSCGSRVAY
jgi:hypothetical protein